MILLFQRNNSSQGTDRVKLIADIGSTCSQKKTNVYTLYWTVCICCSLFVPEP